MSFVVFVYGLALEWYLHKLSEETYLVRAKVLRMKSPCLI